TKTSRVVCMDSQDSVGIGVVASVARPDGILRIMNILAGELGAKRLELLRELVPGAARIAVLVNPASAAQNEFTLRELEPAARAMGVQIQIMNAGTRQEIDAPFETIPPHPHHPLLARTH